MKKLLILLLVLCLFGCNAQQNTEEPTNNETPLFISLRVIYGTFSFSHVSNLFLSIPLSDARR